MRTKIILAALSALLLASAFPPLALSPLSWFSLVPFFWALGSASPGESSAEPRAGICSSMKRPFALGFIFGFVFFLSTVYWVVYSMYLYGGVSIVLSIFFMLLLVVLLSLYSALFGVLWAFTSRRATLLRLFLVPSAWVGLEYLRGLLFTGFPWALIGYTQARVTPVIQIADILGIYGVSFLVVLLNFAIYAYFFNREVAGTKGIFGTTGAARRAAVLVTLVLLTSTLAYGFMKISIIDARFLDSKVVMVGVAQGNIDQSVKWDPAFRQESIKIYRELSLNAAEENVELIIWPESAVPFYLAYEKMDGSLVRGVAKLAGAYLLTGSPHYIDNEPGSREWESYFNSAFLIDPSGEFAGRYDKVKLVPFGEYVPLKRVLFFIKKLTEGYADFTPGPGHMPIEMEKGKLGVLICFESIFPGISSATIKGGAELLVVLTNDGWFGKSSAAYQHFDMAIFRAVENRVYLLRAANRGISGVIDPVGRVGKETGLFTRELLVAKIKMRQESEPKTLFTLYGRFFPIALIFFFVLSLFKFRSRR